MSSGQMKAEAQLAFAREHLVIVSDRLAELAATLHDHGVDRKEDGLYGGMLADVALAVWNIRWEIGPAGGEVQEADARQLTTEQQRELRAAIKKGEP